MALVASVLGARSYEFLLAPTLRVEDGSKIFAYFYSHREWERIFRFKSGYMPLLPNLIGYFSVRVPVQSSPYVLTAVPVLEALAAFVLPFSRGFRVYLRRDALRFVLCLAMVAAPVGTFHLVCHTDFSIWTSLLLSYLLALLPVPRSTLRAVGLLLVAQLFIWSNPLSFVLAPIHVAHALFARDLRTRALRCAWVASHIAHVILAVDRGHAPGLASILEADFLVEWISRTWWHVATSVDRALFGRSVMAESNLFIHGFAGAFLGFVCVVSVLAAQRGVRFFLLSALYFLVALTAMITLTKSDAVMAQPRYRYVQCLVGVVLYIVSGAQALRSLSSPRVRRYWPALAGLALVPASVLNLHEYRAYREPHPGNGPRVRACMQRIADSEALQGGKPCGFKLRCKKVRDWAIDIRPPRCE